MKVWASGQLLIQRPQLESYRAAPIGQSKAHLLCKGETKTGHQRPTKYIKNAFILLRTVREM